MNIENTPECFVQLWRQLERTRRLLGGQYKRYSVRNVLRVWFGYEATDDFVWEVCRMATLGLNNGNDDEPIYGNDILPLPSLYPRKQTLHTASPFRIVQVSMSTKRRKAMNNVEINKQAKLSQHFTLGELCKTSVKTKDGE